LVKFIGNQAHLTGIFTQEVTFLVSQTVEGGSRHREVTEHFFLENSDSDLSISEKEEKVIMADYLRIF